MYAAVVTAFDTPPQYRDIAVPTPQRPTEVLVDVLAAGLHPRVRSQADGSHYTSTDELPLIPGVDGVGRAPDGSLRYFVLPDTTMGSMAGRTVVDLRRSVVLPDDSDPIAIAAAMNPAMSSWLALRRRIEFRAGSKVLVLGATGNAGRMAIQVAKRLGAASVVAVGRRVSVLAELAELGADETIRLDDTAVDDQLAAAASDVDVVIDYLWGEPAAHVMRTLITSRADDSQLLSWIQVGSMAGPTAPIPSAALRAARLQIVGSGQGSVSTHDILTELPGLADEVNRGTFAVEALAVPLTDVAAVWPDSGGKRVVLIP